MYRSTTYVHAYTGLYCKPTSRESSTGREKKCHAILCIGNDAIWREEGGIERTIVTPLIPFHVHFLPIHTHTRSNSQWKSFISSFIFYLILFVPFFHLFWCFFSNIARDERKISGKNRQTSPLIKERKGERWNKGGNLIKISFFFWENINFFWILLGGRLGMRFDLIAIFLALSSSGQNTTVVGVMLRKLLSRCRLLN